MPPIIIPASATSGTGSTLATLRHRLADELGFYASTTVTSVAASGEAARVVLADELRDDEAGYEFLGMPWVYVVSGAQIGTQRRALGQPSVGYQGNYGGLFLSRPYAAALASGVTIEVTSPLPVKRHLAIKGLNDLVNEALARIWIEARISLTGNATRSYSLASYPWLQTYEQTRGIWDSRQYGTSYPTELSACRYRIATNGITRTLVADAIYATSETFELAVIVRADRLVYDGASWAYVAQNAAPGLLGDTYQAAAPEEWVVAIGMVKALQHLTKLTEAHRSLSDDERARVLTGIAQRRRVWALTAASIVADEMPRPLPERTEPLVMGAASADTFVESYSPSDLPLIG